MKMATDDKRWAKKLRKFPPDTLYFISERTEVRCLKMKVGIVEWKERSTGLK